MKFLIVLIILFSGCSKDLKLEPKLPNDYYYQGLILGQKITPIIARKFDLFVLSNSVNSNETSDNPQDGKIYNLRLSFISLKKIDIDEARKLLLKCIQAVLLLVNNDKIIQPYLKNHPFTYKNLSISIIYYDRANRRRRDGALCYSSLSRNIMTYGLEPEIGYIKRYTETYEEALKIIQTQKDKGK